MSSAPVFTAVLSLYVISSSLSLTQGDPQLGQSGHPRCEFCKTRFYDAAQLHDHLVKDHYSCHICERQGILHKYYRDYTDLERHFRSEHFLCEEVWYDTMGCDVIFDMMS